MTGFDFDSLLNAAVVATFGDQVGAEYRRPLEPPFLLQGILTRDHVETVFDADGTPISARSTRFFATRSAFPDGLLPKQGDELYCELTQWVVADVMADAGDGFTLLLGNRADPDIP